MKKAVVVLLGLVLAAWARAEVDFSDWNETDSLLYWMIDDSNTIEFQYAVVYATKEDLTGRTWTADNGYGVKAENLVALPREVEGGIAYEPMEGSHLVTLEYLTELGTENWSSFTFYIELLQWDDVNKVDVRKGVSDWSSYEDLVKNKHVLGSGLDIPSLVVWAPQTSTVPEPTSGMLVLVGGVLLLLRRRRDEV